MNDDRSPVELRAELLRELGPLLYQRFAAAEWGRVLVRMQRARNDGPFVVAGIDVEDIVGDEARIDAALGDAAIHEVLPLIGDAIEALAATFDVELEDVEGGTFLRQPDGSFAWLPGLVRAPSAGFERLRDASIEGTRRSLSGALDACGLSTVDRFDVDVERGEALFVDPSGRRARGGVVLAGSFARRASTWVWAWANPSLSEAERAASLALTDAITPRDLWEITTPQFATDEPTAHALVAIACAATGGAGVLRAAHDGGTVYFVVRSVVAAS